VAELGEACAPPERQGFAEELRAPGRVARAACRLGQRLEAAEVDLVPSSAHEIAGRARLDRVRSERLPQLRDVELEHLARGRGRRVAPQAVDERLGWDDSTRVEQKAR